MMSLTFQVAYLTSAIPGCMSFTNGGDDNFSFVDILNSRAGY